MNKTDGKQLEEFDEEKTWAFTPYEKEVLKSLPIEYKWLARDGDGKLIAYCQKPFKGVYLDIWQVLKSDMFTLNFPDSFQCITWNNKQPCEFRKFL